MSDRQGSAGSTSTPVYGFLCEATNVFYAFESQQEYLAFLAWLQEQTAV
jgi:hypothetical protein